MTDRMHYEVSKRRYGKCICGGADMSFDRWVVVRVGADYRVVQCRACRQVWYTRADYAAELTEEIASPYEWRQIMESDGYHMREEWEEP